MDAIRAVRTLLAAVLPDHAQFPVADPAIDTLTRRVPEIPSIVLSTVDDPQLRTTDGRSGGNVARVQVEIFGERYANAFGIKEIVKATLDEYRGLPFPMSGRYRIWLLDLRDMVADDVSEPEPGTSETPMIVMDFGVRHG